MNAPVTVYLDFVGTRPRFTLLGVAIAVLGMSALTAAGMEYRAVGQKRAALEMRVLEAQRRNERAPEMLARTAQTLAEGTGITRELATPWTQVLADLEKAAGDTANDISVLAVEPDFEKRRVLVKGESRDLSRALEYLKRLQHSQSLAYPMLTSHEVATDDKDRPVRFALIADWRGAQ